MLFNKRIDDINKSQIEDMIASEDDPKTRATLLLVQNLIFALNSVTNLIQDVDIRFNKHREDFEVKSRRDDKIIIQGRTIYKGIMGTLVFAQTLVIGVIVYGYNSFEEVRDQGNRLNYQVQQIENKMSQNKNTYLVKL